MHKLLPRSSEKGHALGMFALTIVGIVSMLVMALGVHASPSYSDLQADAEAAAVAASKEFKRDYTHLDMYEAAKSVLIARGVPITAPDGDFSVETCTTNVGDPDLCPGVNEPARKLVRVTVSVQVEGTWQTAESIVEVPSLDVVLLIQNSEKMADIASQINKDPSVCNPNNCHPFEEVKAAAKDFADTLYFPYDRLSVVTFNKTATVVSALDNQSGGNTVTPAITNLQVFNPGACLYHQEDLDLSVPPGLPYPRTAPIAPYSADPQNPCRLYSNAGVYAGVFSCPMHNATTGPNIENRTSANDPSWCGTTNPAVGFAMASNHLLGAYNFVGNPPVPIPPIVVREDAVRVIVLVATGAPNSAQDDFSQPICPMSARGIYYHLAGCRDQNVLIRHCDDANNAACMNKSYPVDETHIMESVFDPTNYDAYDRAFDMVDLAVENDITIFTIGLGAQIQASAGDINGLAPGATFLKYAADSGGSYRYAPSSSDLPAAFLEIADLLAPSSLPSIIYPTSTPGPTLTSTPDLTATATATVTPTLTGSVTPTPTSTPACSLISLTGGFLQTVSGTGRPRVEIGIQNNNSQAIRLTDFSFDWAAYKAVNTSQTGSKWTFNGITTNIPWTASPLNWSGSGPTLDGNASTVLRFEFSDVDSGWPTNVANTSFGLMATFDDLCSISINPLPTGTPTVTQTSTKTPTPTLTPTRTRTATVTNTPTASGMAFRSVAAQDGTVLESSENSGVGGSMNGTSGTFVLGDDASNRQYRGILSFDTSGLPDTVVITSAVVKIKQGAAPVGSNPFDVLGNLWIDIRKGPFNLAALQLVDFNAVSSTENAGVFNETPVSGWYTAVLSPAARSNVNATGLTQLRLRFGADDNNNLRADYLPFYSGEATLIYQPVLEIKYYYASPTPPALTVTKTPTATTTVTPTRTITPTITRTITRTPGSTATQICFDC